MKFGKIIKRVFQVYVTICIVPPVTKGAIKMVGYTGKLIKNKINNSEKIKEIKDDFKIRRQGVITVDYKKVNN